MTKEQVFELMNGSSTFHLATVENGEPRVRAMMLYKADETGIVFHTGSFKDVYKQIIANPNVQMCFNETKGGIQVRVRGVLEEVMDTNLKDEISHQLSYIEEWGGQCITLISEVCLA